MNRRGFIGGLVGLVASAAVVSAAKPQFVEEPAHHRMKLRTIVVNDKNYQRWSPENERVLIDYFNKNQSLVRRVVS